MAEVKTLSILGDSISTYQGYSNDPEANHTIFANPVFYKSQFPPEKTYWMRILSNLGLSLCVNNSWSGGNLSGKDDSTSGLNRAHNLANNKGESPDLIILFMGLNDLGRNVDSNIFAEDYKETLHIIKKKYPTAAVCCVNLPDRDIYLRKRAEIFNAIIESSVAAMGDNFFVADLFRSRLNNDFYYDNTLDGLHPDEDGMRIIAEIVEESIKQHI